MKRIVLTCIILLLAVSSAFGKVIKYKSYGYSIDGISTEGVFSNNSTITITCGDYTLSGTYVYAKGQSLIKSAVKKSSGTDGSKKTTTGDFFVSNTSSNRLTAKPKDASALSVTLDISQDFSHEELYSDGTRSLLTTGKLILESQGGHYECILSDQQKEECKEDINVYEILYGSQCTFTSAGTKWIGNICNRGDNKTALSEGMLFGDNDKLIAQIGCENGNYFVSLFDKDYCGLITVSVTQEELSKNDWWTNINSYFHGKEDGKILYENGDVFQGKIYGKKHFLIPVEGSVILKSGMLLKDDWIQNYDSRILTPNTSSQISQFVFPSDIKNSLDSRATTYYKTSLLDCIKNGGVEEAAFCINDYFTKCSPELRFSSELSELFNRYAQHILALNLKKGVKGSDYIMTRLETIFSSNKSRLNTIQRAYSKMKIMAEDEALYGKIMLFQDEYGARHDHLLHYRHSDDVPRDLLVWDIDLLDLAEKKVDITIQEYKENFGETVLIEGEYKDCIFKNIGNDMNFRLDGQGVIYNLLERKFYIDYTTTHYQYVFTDKAEVDGTFHLYEKNGVTYRVFYKNDAGDLYYRLGLPNTAFNYTEDHRLLSSTYQWRWEGERIHYAKGVYLIYKEFDDATGYWTDCDACVEIRGHYHPLYHIKRDIHY